MAELLSDYIEVQQMIENDRPLGKMLKSLFEEESSVVVMIEDINKHFPSSNHLFDCWNSINRKLESTPLQNQSTTGNNVIINDKYFYGCLYVTIMMEDTSDPLESPVLVSLTTILRVGLLHGGNEFLKEECLKVFKAGFKRIQTRDLMEWPITSQFLFDSLKAIKAMAMGSALINSYIHILMLYSAKHYNMVNNLSLADANSPVGVLAFACLANLLVKNSPDKEIIMETMLENIEHVMESNNGLTSFQISVKQSNFRQMIRQVGSALTSCTDQIFFGILRVAERHPKSKSLVFIINQLPYPLFCQLVNVVVKVCNRSYSQPFQMFCFNMLESPYITENQEEARTLDGLYQKVAESIVWPVQKFDHQPVIDTIKLVYAMLQIENTLVKNLVFNMTQTYSVMADLMTYINQHCNENWKQEYKVTNQYYVSVYCRLLILNQHAWKHQQFAQFSSLLLNANPHDLFPCLKDFKALITSENFAQREVQCVILNTFVHIANQISPQAIHFLKVLHETIFGSLKTGNCYYNLIVLKTNDCDATIKNMVTHRLVTLKDIEHLSELCKNLRGWRLMADLVIHMDFVLPKAILYFSEHLLQMRPHILKDTSVIYIIRFFGDVLERKSKTGQKHEKEILMRFAVFLEGCLLNRLLPVNALPIALLTMRKYHVSFNRPLARLSTMCEAVEVVTRDAFTQLIANRGDFNAIVALTRDVSYYGEMQMVFGDLELFKWKPETRTAIENGIQFMPTVRNFTTLGLVMVHCMTKLAIRYDDLLNVTINALCQLLKYEQPRLKECCIDSLYDTALFRTSSFDVMIPHIYDLLTTHNSLNAVTALNMYSKLFSKEHSIPNDWQTFTIALAVGDTDVCQLIDPDVFEAFMKKLHPYFETYFIHIMFYANNICDDSEHFLMPEYRKKIISEKLSKERRHQIYTTLIKYFTAEYRTKILVYIYRNLNDQYMQVSHPDSMIEDILVITYQALKQHIEYPELCRYHYERTLGQIKKIETCTSKKIGNGINADDIIAIIINKLVKLLHNLNEKHLVLMKFFHVLFATIDWNYSGIYNAIVDEGLNGKLRKNVLRLLDIYDMHNHVFHYNDQLTDTELQSHPILSICDRV